MAMKRISAWLRSASLLTKKNRALPRHAAPLQLECLEDRFAPAVLANEAYVASLYYALLGRSPDTAGLLNWTTQLNAGASRAQVALEIENSAEFTGRAVQIFYLDFLGRTADSIGLNLDVQAVLKGTSLDQIKANILGSEEFFSKHGGTMDSYLNAVFFAELGRAIDRSGLAAFVAATPNNPVGRVHSALEIMRSTEGDEVEITSIYEVALGRLADAGGAAAWLNQFQQGATDAEIIAGIVGADEYFAPIQTFAATATDVNAVPQTFVANIDKFVTSLPGAEQLNATIITNPALVLP